MTRTTLLWANLLWLAAFAWLPGAAIGAPVNSSSAAVAVSRWLAADPTPLAEKVGHAVKNVQTLRDGQGTALYHVVQLAPSGFVIVAADDQVGPMVAFAARGAFNPSAKNALSTLLNKDLPARLAQARAHPGAARVASARRQWRQLGEGSKFPTPGAGALVATVSAIRVAPFLATLWDQQTIGDAGVVSCYNYYTPPYAAGSTSNYPCGCVATAMAQLMYYFQYPVAGVGTNLFVIGINGALDFATLRGGDGAGGPYLWSDMPPAPQNATAAQCQAVGALTYDAGVAINMAYAANGSDSTLLAARDALAGTFLYSNAIIGGQDNPLFSLSSVLVNMVNPNLDARRPVLFGIWGSPVEGHCAVCDGYGYIGSTLYHHLNLGFSGTDNAWYALPDIDTADELTYTNISSCIYNVCPGGGGEIVSGRIVDGSGNPVPNAAVTATRPGGGVYAAASDTNGIYALVNLPSNSQYALTVSQAGYSKATGHWSTGISQNGAAATGNVWGANFVLTATGEPSILIPPQSQTALVGATAAFAVSAAGIGPLAYQWTQDGVSLANTGGSLTLTNVSAANAGTYAVIVSNAYGAAASAGAVLNVAQAGGTQWVLNGSFETGSFAGWLGSGNLIDTFVTTGSLYVHAGEYGAELGPSGSLGFLSQQLAVTNGSYVLSCWLDSPDGKTPNEFVVSWNGTNLFDQTDMGATGWTNLQFIVAASAAGAPLEFGFRNDNSYFGLDAITVNNLVSATAPPQIVAPPASQAAALGAIAVFSATAAGVPEPSYQWQFNGANLAGATDSTLSFSAIQAANAGSYQVIVSNAVGAVTSPPVTLSITGVPVLFAVGAAGIQVNSSAVMLTLTTLTGQGTVVVQASADLAYWTPVFTNAPAFGALQLTDAPPANFPCRFYRAVVQTLP